MTTLSTPHPQALRYAERDASHSVIQKILVIVDPTAQQHPCIEKAARIAASCGATLELFVCDVEPELPDNWAGGNKTAEYRDLLRRRRLEELQRLATPLRQQGLSVTTASEWHAPLEEGIGQHAIRARADLVVKDTHRHAATPRVTLTQTDWNLIRQMAAPILMARPARWARRPRIAVSVDPCHPADRPVALDEAMFDTGCSIAGALAGEVEVLHVLQSPPHLPGDKVSTEAKSKAEALARAAVEGLVHRHCAPVGAIQFVEGTIPEGIVDFVTARQPDILVMGAVGRSRWGQSAATGTAAQILERVDCDMLIVKPPGFVSPLLITDNPN